MITQVVHCWIQDFCRLLRSSVRAEIYAILHALQIVRSHPHRVMLWTDCAAVVRKFRRLVAGHTLSVNSAHADLWNEISVCLQNWQASTHITKVAAHQTLELLLLKRGALGTMPW
jgi:ribonuclease HI